MFSYLIIKPVSFGGIDMTGRVYAKNSGIAWLGDFPEGYKEMSAAELNNLPAQNFDRFEVVFSETSVPKGEFLEWIWNNTDFQKLTGPTLAEIQTFTVNAKQMWSDRIGMIQSLQVQVLNAADFASLSKQHRKLLLGATWKNFTETDWDAVGLDDSGYVGDYNYTLQQWMKFGSLIR